MQTRGGNRCKLEEGTNVNSRREQMKPPGTTTENPKGEKRKNEGLKKKSARLSPCAPIHYLVILRSSPYFT